MNIQGYLKYKTRWEIILWICFALVQVNANIAVVLMDLSSSNIAWWQPICWEISSALSIAMLIPVLLNFDKRYPLSLKNVKKHLPLHIVFTIPFCVAHVLIMVIIREFVYLQMEATYSFGHWPTELFYEYLKDFRSYFTIIGIIYLYRFVLFRLQGEASILDSGETTPKIATVTPQNERVEHLLVKKLGKEFLIKPEQIDWLEACGNYVNLHVAGRIYPFRGTMKSMADILDKNDFIRIHRSYIVNHNQIKSIEPLDSGDAKIELNEGRKLPFSRRYRAEFKR
jgi:hypothetical protein